MRRKYINLLLFSSVSILLSACSFDQPAVDSSSISSISSTIEPSSTSSIISSQESDSSSEITSSSFFSSESSDSFSSSVEPISSSIESSTSSSEIITSSSIDSSITSEDSSSDTNSSTSIHEHNFSEWQNKPATCLEEGLETRTCLECHLNEMIKRPALGHDLVHHNSRAASCTRVGWIAYDTCTRCDYTTYQEIPATGHINTTTKEENRIEPSCLDEGSYDLVTYCRDDNVIISTEQKIIPALGHDLIHYDYQTATCTRVGWNAYDRCSRCDYSTKVEIPATGHINTATREENRINPTCITSGSCDVVIYCLDDNAVISREAQILPALGHDYVHHNAKAATCTEDGWNEYYTCTRCNYSTYSSIPKTGHKPSAAVTENMIDATCTDSGSYDSVIYCSECGEELSRSQEIIAPLRHQYRTIEGVDPSYENSGYYVLECTRCGVIIREEYPQWEHRFAPVWSADDETHWHGCLDSGYSFVRGDEVPHSYDLIGSTEPGWLDLNGTGYNGFNEYKCSICGHEYLEVIPAKQHSFASDWTYDENSHYHLCLEEGFEDLKKDLSEHTFGDWIIDTERTADERGSKHHICSICGYREDEEIESLIELATEVLDFELNEDNESYSVSGNLFYKILSFEELYIPSTYNDLPVTAVKNIHCNWDITYLNVPSSIKELKEDAFSCCYFKRVDLHEGLETIGPSAFSTCRNLETINIPNSVTAIGENAFKDCSSLTSISLPKNIAAIGNYAFFGCSSVKTVFYDIPYLIVDLYYRFGFLNIETIVIGDNVIYVPEGLTDKASEVIFGKSVEIIEELPGVFTEITLPDGLRVIGDYAFINNGPLLTINLPSSLERIGDLAFINCPNLSNVTFDGTMAQYLAIENCQIGITVHCLDGDIIPE